MRSLYFPLIIFWNAATGQVCMRGDVSLDIAGAAPCGARDGAERHEIRWYQVCPYLRARSFKRQLSERRKAEIEGESDMKQFLTKYQFKSGSPQACRHDIS